jgi:hypothetical protein
VADGEPGLMVTLALAAALATTPATAETGWREVVVGQEVVITDSPFGAVVAAELAALRAVFGTGTGGLEVAPVGPVSTIACARRETWDLLVGTNRPAASARGLYLNRADGAWLVLDLSGGPEEALRTARHELTHALAAQNFPRLPPALSEGLAELYATTEVDGDRVRVGRPVEAWRRRILANGLDAEALLATTNPHAEGANRAADTYAAGWALVHWLVEGDAPRDALADLVARIAAGDQARDAISAATGLDPAELAKRVVHHVRGLEASSSGRRVGSRTTTSPQVRTLEPAEVAGRLAELALAAGQESVAHDLAGDAHLAAGRDPVAAAHLAEVLDGAGRHDEASALWALALELGLDHPRLLVVAGARALNQGAFGEAQRLASRATEVLPRYAEAHALDARARLAGAGSPAQALAAVRRARNLVPFRAELVVLEAVALAAVGEFSAARTLVENVLPSLDPELLDRAREEVERRILVDTARRALASGDHPSALAALDAALDITTDLNAHASLTRSRESVAAALGAAR